MGLDSATYNEEDLSNIFAYAIENSKPGITLDKIKEIFQAVCRLYI